MPPRAVYLATSSPRPRRSLGILPSFRRRRPRPGKKMGAALSSIPFLLISPLIARRRRPSQSRSTCLPPPHTHALSLWDFRVERDDDDAELGRELSLTGCLTLSSYCGLLRTDCCVFLSSNGPDRRSRPPTRRRYRSSSRVCFPIPSYGYLFVRHTGTLLSPLKVCDARRELLSLSLHTLSTLVLDFSLEG